MRWRFSRVGIRQMHEGSDRSGGFVLRGSQKLVDLDANTHLTIGPSRTSSTHSCSSSAFMHVRQIEDVDQVQQFRARMRGMTK